MEKKSFKRRLKEHFVQVMRTKTSPHALAMGFAVGTFIALLPTPGISIFIAIPVFAIFKNWSKYAMFFSMVVWNPITIAPLYALSFSLGDLIFGSTNILELELTFWHKVVHYSRRFLIGSLIVSSSSAVISYYMFYWLAKLYQRKK